MFKLLMLPHCTKQIASDRNLARAATLLGQYDKQDARAAGERTDAGHLREQRAAGLKWRTGARASLSKNSSPQPYLAGLARFGATAAQTHTFSSLSLTLLILSAAAPTASPTIHCSGAAATLGGPAERGTHS